MGVKMMRWTPWPSVTSSSRKKFEARIKVQKMEGVKMDAEEKRFWVEIKWKGQKNKGLRNLRRSVKRNFTQLGGFLTDGVFQWDEEFSSVCHFSRVKDGALFNPWEVTFSVFTGLSQEQRHTFLVGSATLNVAEYASVATKKDLEISLPLLIPSITTQDTPMLCLCLGMTELGSAATMSRWIHPVTSSPSSEETLSPPRKDVRSTLKLRLFRRRKKASHTTGNVDVDSSSALDTDSLDDDDDDVDDILKDGCRDSNTQVSVNYETIAYANFARGALNSSWVYYNDRMPSEVGYPTATVCELPLKESSKRRILAWRRRKTNVQTLKPKVEAEPLLKKDYGETGGDDIDFDRRQLSSSDESSLGWSKTEEGSSTSRSSFSEFGDDNFVVGSWEMKEVISRDGNMKLQAQVFFASIDQRSERAAGESACTTLVGVIANWLQSNQFEVPIKSVFDGLIRDGSLEWRKLCENEEYRQRFPDKHFDLETVLQAEIRPLAVAAEKSFIGFFHPEGDFDFLHGAMSFDNIWDEISKNGSELSKNSEPLVYIVSWNDHFFVLRVEADAYYIIDTLGERLYEGCNQAYILKFDKDTTISRRPADSKESVKGSANDSKKKTSGEQATRVNNEGKSEANEEIVCKGKESCKEYIKSFLAAIPIREMQADIKKGLMAASTPIHHRLQIEFHYTQLTHSAAKCS
ncbi:hypothetical protein M5689_001471 [Euphorbia peplus]|nr:hypothetical protein M5689_001471 [Euphorbia peplus]